MAKIYGTLGRRDADEPKPRAPILTSLSAGVARREYQAAGIILAAVFIVVIINVTSRAIGRPVIWADELAIYGMAWAAFIGASAGLAGHHHIAINLLSDALPRTTAKILAIAVDLGLLILLICLAIILWRWFDPIAYLSAPSPNDYSLQTFNFMHSEPTTTLGIRKIWIWLALPIFNATALLHISARLFERPAQ